MIAWRSWSPTNATVPGKCRTLVLVRVEVRIQRVEVALGKDDVELLDAAPVVKHALVDGLTNGECDALVYDSEVPEVALCVDGPADDLIHVAQNIVDVLSLFKAIQQE